MIASSGVVVEVAGIVVEVVVVVMDVVVVSTVVLVDGFFVAAGVSVDAFVAGGFEASLVQAARVSIAVVITINPRRIVPPFADATETPYVSRSDATPAIRLLHEGRPPQRGVRLTNEPIVRLGGAGRTEDSRMGGMGAL